MSYFVDMRDAERQYARVKAERDEACDKISHLNRLAGIYGSALADIAEETGTPYGAAAQKALDKAAAFERGAAESVAPSAPTRPSDPAGGETARFTTEEPS